MRDECRSSSPAACAPVSQDSALQTTARGQRAASAFPTVLLKIHSKRVAGSKLQRPQVMCESFQLEIQRTCHCLMERQNEFFVVSHPPLVLDEGCTHGRNLGAICSLIPTGSDVMGRKPIIHFCSGQTIAWIRLSPHYVVNKVLLAQTVSACVYSILFSQYKGRTECLAGTSKVTLLSDLLPG